MTKLSRKTQYGEFRIQSLRECAGDYSGTSADFAAQYMRERVVTGPNWDGERENAVVLLLNARHRVIGHSVISVGILDQVLVHPRDVFRAAILANAGAIILSHNHPSGDPTPGEADIKVTRDLIRAGMLLRISLLDHVIMGEATESYPRGFVSLRERGHFAI